MQPSPGKLRSPRKRALEIGTESAKFKDTDAQYCATCGHPIVAGMPHGHYEAGAQGTTALGAKPIQADAFKVR